MDPAEVTARFESWAAALVRRNRDVAGLLEAGDLVSEAWVAWCVRGTWARARGAMLDAVRRERARRLASAAEPDDLACLGADPVPDRPTVGRDAWLVARSREGATSAEVGRELGLSQPRAWELSRRARLREEAARVAARRREFARANRNVGKPRSTADALRRGA